MPESSSPDTFVQISEVDIDIGGLIAYCVHRSAGGISSFIGTTRDSFQGKRVLRLEYEAYRPMAMRELLRITDDARRRWELYRIAVVHRVGDVPVGEASVAVVASSEHRSPAIEAVAWMIDTLKATVPVWKREWYEGDECAWKENCEGCRRSMVRDSH